MPDFELRDLRENHAQTLSKMPIKCLYILTIATITTIFVIQSSLQTVPNFIGKYSNAKNRSKQKLRGGIYFTTKSIRRRIYSCDLLCRKLEFYHIFEQ